MDLAREAPRHLAARALRVFAGLGMIPSSQGGIVATKYKVTKLGPLVAGFSEAFGINNLSPAWDGHAGSAR
jgi:hypothetical protein